MSAAQQTKLSAVMKMKKIETIVSNHYSTVMHMSVCEMIVQVLGIRKLQGVSAKP